MERTKRNSARKENGGVNTETGEYNCKTIRKGMLLLGGMKISM